MDTRIINRRTFIAATVGLAGSTLGCCPPSAAASPTEPLRSDGPFVHQSSWAYDLIQQLAQRGVYIGLPDGSFAGKIALTRHQFAQTLRVIFAQLTYFEGRGINLDFGRTMKFPQALRTLVAELTPEFIEQGVDASLLKPVVDRFEQLWISPVPRGVTEPVDLPGSSFSKAPLWPANGLARTFGANLARERWANGTLCLLIDEAVPSKPQTPVAIPLQSLPEARTDPYAAEVLLGHNAEMWRLLRQSGAPRFSKWGWTRDLFQLKATWNTARGSVIALREQHTYPSPDGQFRFSGTGTTMANGKHLPMMLGSCLGGGYVSVNVHDWLLPEPFALYWGKPGSAVAYLRCRVRSGNRNTVQLFALDLRTGIILNAAIA